MPGGLLVLVGVVAVFWALRQMGRMTPAQSRAFSTRLLGYGLVGVSAFLALRGALVLAVPLFAAGAGLLGFQSWLPQGRKPGAAEAPPPTPQTQMSQAEALSVLGLERGASRQDVLAAHKRLQRANHPDVGGTNYLAGKINQARDVLLAG